MRQILQLLVALLLISLNETVPALSQGAAGPLPLVISQPSVKPPETDAPVHNNASDLSPRPTLVTGSQDTFDRQHMRLLLALGGGGCKAVAQIGVLRSLEKHHIAINSIIGTSMGATIGALYCAGVSPDDIEKLFVDRTIQRALISHLVLKTLARPLCDLTYIIVPKPYGGLTSAHAYLHLLEKKLPSSFSDLKIPFGAVVTNLTDGETTVLAAGNLPKAVLASNTVPPVMRPVLINGKLYVDGGLKANLPSELARSLGGEVVVSVLVDKAIQPEPNEKFRSLKAVVSRVTDLILGAADKQHARDTDILIYPNVDDVPLVTKNVSLIKKAIASGEKATDQVIPKIERELAVSSKIVGQ